LLHSRDGEAVSARLLKEKIGQLLDRRRVLYEQADVIVSTTEREPGDVAALIAEKLRHRHA
jgi:shikimate kinase